MTQQRISVQDRWRLEEHPPTLCVDSKGKNIRYHAHRSWRPPDAHTQGLTPGGVWLVAYTAKGRRQTDTALLLGRKYEK